MKQVNTNKYSVAWFALSECVSRGEKERALGVFRLLSHSLQDSALKDQLKGDLYFSFKDISNAIKYYVQAADEYGKKNQLVQACALYEHVSILAPKKFIYKFNCLALYFQLNSSLKIKKTVDQIVQMLVTKKDYDELFHSLDQLPIQKNMIYISCISGIYEKENKITKELELFLKKIIEKIILSKNKSLLQEFLLLLQDTHEDLYLCAQQYI